MALLAVLARRLGMSEAESGFTAVGKGRDVLAAALVGKRVLIAVDDVWDRGTLDALLGLAPGCTLLFTTRKTEMAAVVNATQIRVDELTGDQALSLLAAWTGQALAGLPVEAGLLCARVGNMALGVAVAGAMIARGRSPEDVLALINQDLALVGADFDPAYPYRNLLAAIEAGIGELAAGDQDRYVQLAVFAGSSPFPRDAANALWEPGLSEAASGDLLAELTGRSLLTEARSGWYSAHDLQYEVLIRKLGALWLAEAHARLLDVYRSRYPGGWAGSASDAYMGRALTGHLRAAGRDSELRATLTDPAWIQARLIHGGLPDLISDYEGADDLLTVQIVQALRLSAPALAADPRQLLGQLTGRLLGHPEPAVAAWVAGLSRAGGPQPWLAPATAALTPPTSALQQVLVGHSGPVWSVAVTRDGTRAVSGGFDQMLRVWDPAAGTQQSCYASPAGMIWSVALTADGTRAITTAGDDGAVQVWNLADGTVERSLTGHSGPSGPVAVTGDGTRAVTGGTDGAARVWDPLAGAQLYTLTGHRGHVLSAAITDDGCYAVTGGDDGTARVWDLTDGTEQYTLTGIPQHGLLPGHPSHVQAVAVTPDGTRAIAGGTSGILPVWDLAAGIREQTLTIDTMTAWPTVVSAAIIADGTQAISCGTDGLARLWDLATGAQSNVLAGHTGTVRSVAVTADGPRAVTCGDDGTVRVWDLARARHQPGGQAGSVYSLAVTPDGTRAVTGGGDGVARVWDLGSGALQQSLTGHPSLVRSVAITRDGQRAITGGDGGYLLIWDLVTGTVQRTIPGHITTMLALAVTPDGTRAVTGGYDGNAWVWDLTAGTGQALTGHHGQVLAAAITPDGTRGITGGDGGTVLAWNLETRTHQALAGFRGQVHSTAITPDGTRALAGGANDAVIMWDLATGTAQQVLTGHVFTVSVVAFTSDGAHAVIGGHNGTVLVLDLLRDTVLARWDGDYPVVGCLVASTQLFKIVVGQRRGQPYVLELRNYP